MQGRLRLLFLFVLVFLSFGVLHAQEKKEPQDSLVRLIEASSAQLIEVDGISYRKVIGPARFLHNNTYLLCDTALWNVNTNIINAIGHVQVIQDNTFLTSDKIDYIVEDNLAQFRGTLVELFDKEGNVLRTNFLDYNTKDSIGTFYSGGAMRNVDGNLIESRNGEYRAIDKMFSFIGDVQMFTDSVFIKSNKVDYNTVENKAFFGKKTTAWQEDNMLFANDGEFNRPEDIFHFKQDSYILTKNQEIWADTLTYFRLTGIAELVNNIQILDTVQKAYCFADEAMYYPSPFKVEMTRKPSVAMYTVENGVRDTVFMAADTLKYYTVPYCDIDSVIVAQAFERKKLAELDPMAEVEKQSSEQHRKKEDGAAPDALENAQKSSAKGLEKAGGGTALRSPAKAEKLQNAVVPSGKTADDSAALAAAKDSLGGTLENVTDSLKTAADSLGIGASDSTAVVKDTTAVTFIDAWHKVKVFRSDLQALCDSLVYTGVDSIARMYINPVMWNNIKNQFTADSMQIIMKNNVLSKANLISNAFVATQEDTVHYNQIKGAEMVAYFRDNDIYRFDALGGASMIFYLQEDSVITVMNQKEGKMLSAQIKERQIQRIKYVENLTNNALPVYNLPLEDQRLKGFNWRGPERPLTRHEVSDRKVKDSQRSHFKSVPFPTYPFTEVYFSETRDQILRYKAVSDSLRREAELARLRAKQQEELLAQEEESAKKDSLDIATDTLKTATDSLNKSDSLAADSLSVDSATLELQKQLAEYAKQDTVYTATIDSLTAKLISKKDLAALPKQERKTIRKEQSVIKKDLKRAEKQRARIRKKIRKLEKLIEKL